jgi:exodeoxyribonuclease V beta subunit
VTREEIPVFDVCGPLPTGITILEASAGTGKTFTIAALAARYVAEGVRLEKMLLVTFTRMATGELRSRVRERLVSAERGLRLHLAGAPLPADDTVLATLAEGPDEEIANRQRRLADALADFDAATIDTIQGFCGHVLSGLGVAGDTERDVEFVEDLKDLLTEVVDDLYVRRFHRHDGMPPITLEEAMTVARRAVNNPDAAVEPTGLKYENPVAMKVRLADAVRREVDRRKRRGGLITYHDQLTRLEATLTDDEREAAARARLRERYRVALVDEFQDTDQTQWHIFRAVFGSDGADLILIGDPKQAIYSFRGADVYAYLTASSEAGVKATLGTNWRSDEQLIDAYDALFGNAELGHKDISYRREVKAPEAHAEPGMDGAPVPTALRLRVAGRDSRLMRLTDKGYAGKQSAKAHIADDLAADVVRLLSSGARVAVRHPERADEEWEAIEPRHVAVLVQTNKDAELVRSELAAVGVPAVISGGGSVFDTQPARDWLRLLEALERPTAPGRARAAVLTPFFGWTAKEVTGAGDHEWEEVHSELHQWSGVLTRRGVATLLETVTLQKRMPERVLAYDGGERDMADVRHLGELLHAAAVADKLGPTALAAWLRRRIAESDRDRDSEERSRRLESDAEAAQVLTVHRSKGLEFPVVYCPFLWSAAYIPDKEPPIYHDPDNGDRRTIDLRGKRSRGWRHYYAEQRDEELRLAYVALTRARHQAVVWWAGSYEGRESPLSRLLLGRSEDGRIQDAVYVPEDDDMVALLEELAAGAPGCISVERSTGGDGTLWEPSSRPDAQLTASHFGRELDVHWRRLSYTSLTARTHEPRVASEPDDRRITDEGEPDTVEAVDAEIGTDDPLGLRDVPSLLRDMPGGADVGTFVHRVLQDVDFASNDLASDLADAARRGLRGSSLDVGLRSELVAGLEAALATPLGELAGGWALRDFGLDDRVDELAFEFPVVGGDQPTGAATVAGIADVLRRQIAAEEPVAGYGNRLDDPVLAATLRGYMAGNIDLVLRLPAPQGASRFAVIDYKTNWLGFDGLPLSAWHYRPEALSEAMQRRHYPLQALVYSVALHRYLRWRLPGYDIAEHFAGILYLFVRGMTGQHCPAVDGQPCGVFSWRPADELVTDLSDLLDRGDQL